LSGGGGKIFIEFVAVAELHETEDRTAEKATKMVVVAEIAAL
jgi:hypothetical protein